MSSTGKVSEGLSREEFEKWWLSDQVSDEESECSAEMWKAAQWGYAAASSLKQAEPLSSPRLLPEYARHEDARVVKLAESPSQASTQPRSQPSDEFISAMINEYTDPAEEYGSDFPVHDLRGMIIDTWHSALKLAESISQATKEEWARRIAEETPNYSVGPTASEWEARVLAILNEEEVK